MKRRLSVIACAAISTLFLLISAPHARAEDEKFAFGHRFTPCASWYRDFALSTYTCTYTDMDITVPDIQDHRDLERVVQELQQQIASLQMRVQALESRP